MKTLKTEKTDQELDIFYNINPSKNWDFNLQKKLVSKSLSNSSKDLKFNLILLLLVFVNVGYVWNSLSNEKTDKQNSRNEHFKIIYDDLLISNF